MVDHSPSVNTTTGSATRGSIMLLRRKSITNWAYLSCKSKSDTLCLYSTNTVSLAMHHSPTWSFSSDRIVRDKSEKSPISKFDQSSWLVLLINQRSRGKNMFLNSSQQVIICAKPLRSCKASSLTSQYDSSSKQLSSAASPQIGNLKIQPEGITNTIFIPTRTLFKLQCPETPILFKRCICIRTV